MQEESDTGPDILTSEEFANIESEGFTLLTRQLQVKSFKSFPISQTNDSYHRLKHLQSFLSMTTKIMTSTLEINQSQLMKIPEQ